MGHSSPETTAIYQHLAGEYYKEQAEKLNSRVHVDKETRATPDNVTP